LEEEKKALKQRAEEAKCKRDEREAALKNLVTDFDIVKEQVYELRVRENNSFFKYLLLLFFF
jgi:hypothetical protein